MRDKKSKGKRDPTERWQLRLYIAGRTPNSIRALHNLKAVCEGSPKLRYRLQVIDLRKHPALGRGDQILATPTLVRKLPLPIKMIIGDLSHIDRVLVGLDLQPMGSKR